MKEFQFLLIHASSLSSQKISVVADLIILVSFAVALVYYLISLVSSRLINIFFNLKKKNIAEWQVKKGDCSYRRKSVGSKSLSQKIQLCHHFRCAKTFLSLEFPIDKNEDVLNHLIWMFWAGDRNILLCFCFSSNLKHNNYFSHVLAPFCGQAEVGLGLWLGRQRVTPLSPPEPLCPTAHSLLLWGSPCPWGGE